MSTSLFFVVRFPDVAVVTIGRCELTEVGGGQFVADTVPGRLTLVAFSKSEAFPGACSSTSNLPIPLSYADKGSLVSGTDCGLAKFIDLFRSWAVECFHSFQALDWFYCQWIPSWKSTRRMHQ